jgi:hypothetical protein
MRELTANEIASVSGGLTDLEEAAIALLGVAVGAATGGLGVAAAFAALGSTGLSSLQIYQELC